MVAVDTNVLIRWVLRDNQAQALKADALLNDAADDSVLLDRIILAEFSYVLRSYYEYSRQLVITNIQALLQAKQFTIPDRGLVERAVANCAAHPSLSFEDCWQWAQYAAGRIDGVLSFDNALQKRIKSE